MTRTNNHSAKKTQKMLYCKIERATLKINGGILVDIQRRMFSTIPLCHCRT